MDKNTADAIEWSSGLLGAAAVLIAMIGFSTSVGSRASDNARQIKVACITHGGDWNQGTCLQSRQTGGTR